MGTSRYDPIDFERYGFVTNEKGYFQLHDEQGKLLLYIDPKPDVTTGKIYLAISAPWAEAFDLPRIPSAQFIAELMDMYGRELPEVENPEQAMTADPRLEGYAMVDMGVGFRWVNGPYAIEQRYACLMLMRETSEGRWTDIAMIHRYSSQADLSASLKRHEFSVWVDDSVPEDRP